MPVASKVTRPSASIQPALLQVWGGVECSVVRVGDGWRDQVRETGHHGRLDDLDRIAALGVRTLRYPVLWERCADGPVHCGWAWHDERLGRLRDLGITPIVGLVHHGSGPPGTHHLKQDWAEGLARHAAAVAARYPWVTHWTPVNEPLTTARFSGLYGLWHPHMSSEPAFGAMLFNQCRGVLLAMREIRGRIPSAKLVQTEDLGRVFSTRRLAGQAAHDNGRRWLSLDLLCGQVDRAHPAWRRFSDIGVPLPWIDEFRADPGPDIVGVNHYVTSDRFLDHRISLYPARMHGGNGREAYVDTEAARMDLPSGETGWGARLREAWDRYRRPMAVTEAHLGCRDEAEQVRWLIEAWQAAATVRGEGADIRAVTAWSLFGAVDWDSMLRDGHGRYEAGVWDASAIPPRPTSLAAAIRALAQTGHYDAPILAEAGWWRRDDRLHQAARRA